MPDVGWPELLIILVVALVIFGPKRLPDLGKSLGRGIREFRNGVSGLHDHVESDEGGKDQGVVAAVSAPVADIAPGEVKGGETVPKEAVETPHGSASAAG
jgi:sec-independent protein translocase protein TatA